MINKIPVSMVNPLNRSNVGLGNVDNTSDINKPVSTAQQTALNGKTNSVDLATPYATTGGDLVRTPFGYTTHALRSRDKTDMVFNSLQWGRWEQRPQGAFRPRFWGSIDHGYILEYDPDLSQEWRYASGPNAGSPIHAWMTPGAFEEIKFIPGGCLYAKNGAEVTYSTFFSADPAASVVDDGGELRGLKLGPVNNGLRMLSTVGTDAFVNSAVTIEIDVVQTSDTGFQNIVKVIPTASPSANYLRLSRYGNDGTTNARKPVLRVVESSTIRTELTGGNIFGPDYLNKVSTIRMVAQANNYRVQDGLSGEIFDKTVSQFPAGMAFIWLGQDEAGSGVLQGYIRAVRIYKTARPACISKIIDYSMTMMSGPSKLQFQPSQNPKCITFGGGKCDAEVRFEVNPGDVWANDVTSGRTYAERSEIRAVSEMAIGTTYWTAFSLIVEEHGLGPSDSDFTIHMQYHGGSGTAPSPSPWLSLNLGTRSAAMQDLRFSVQSADMSGVLAPVQRFSVPGYLPGKRFDFVIQSKVGATDGILKIWCNGGVLVDITGQVGYPSMAAGGYSKIGVYRSKCAEVSSVRFNNVIMQGLTDLTNLITSPKPWVVG